MRNHRNKGQELVEFALIASIVLIFLFGIIDWGIAFLNHETLAQRAAWAARYYSATADDGGARNIVLNGTPAGSGYTPSGLTGGMIDIAVATSADPGSFTGATVWRQHVRVTVSGYQYQMFTPFVGQLIQSADVVASHPMEN